jgi:CRISPR type IV-associated protein Csf3
MMRTLKVTAHLQAPVVSDAFLPLDGVLYFLYMREKYGDQAVTIPGRNHETKGPDGFLPLKRCQTHTQQWYYACSFAQWSVPCVEDTGYWHKRFDTHATRMLDHGRIKGRLDQGSGKYRTYRMPVFTRHALSVHWYCVGERDALSALLRFATHLGKKYSQGYGAVLRWDIEPAPEDYSAVGPDGQLMRAIPSDTPGAVICGYRPSYWDRRNQAPCRMPELKENIT